VSILDKGMLISMNIGTWGAKKVDKKITKEVHNQTGADEKSGHYSKNLLPDVIEKIKKFENMVRNEFKKNTLPWDDDGVRLVPNTVYFDTVALLNKYAAEFEEMIERELFSQYEQHKAQRKAVAGSEYNESDYPDLDFLRKKFKFVVKFRNIPDAGDFRTELCNDEAEKIRASIKETTNNAIRDAMASIYCKLQKSIDCLAAKMNEGTKYKDPIFRDSIIENIRDICDVIPRLNITGDKNLELLGIEVQNKLASIQPESLRESPELRKETAKTASEISNKISQYMGAM
jgi:hypothetical protein